MMNEMKELAQLLKELGDIANQIEAGVGPDEVVRDPILGGEHRRRDILRLMFESHMKRLIQLNPCFVVRQAFNEIDDETLGYHCANIVRNAAVDVAKECFEEYKNVLGIKYMEEEEARLFS